MFSLTFFLLVFLPPLILGYQNVKFTALVYRHGDRTPVNLYPNDPYRNQSYWPVRFGQLTNEGKRQHFKYGRWLRDRYSHLLSEKYDPTQVHIQSTDVDRTLMSAQANLAGMYPPVGNEIWNNHLMWQPIPIHTRLEHDDEMLAMKKYCEKYEIEKQKYITSEVYLGELKKYKTLMAYLTKNTGMKVKHFEDIEDIYSCLTIENLYNLTLPSWTASVFPDKLRVPAGHSFAISAATPIMARLLIGPLVKHIINTMENVVNGNSTLKMSIYSGHDFTVGTLLTALGVFDGVCPSYTSTVFLELIEDQLEGHGYGNVRKNENDNVESNYYIRLLYRNTVEIVEPKVLSIPNCGTLCPLPKFIELYSHLITVNWEKECQVKHLYLTAVYILLFVLGASYLTWKMLCIQYPAFLRPAIEMRLLQVKTAAAEVENLNP